MFFLPMNQEMHMSNFSKRVFGSFSGSIAAAVALGALMLAGGTAALAQNEKRTVYKENDFHWQGNLKPGQTLEIIGRNGGIDANGAAGDAAQVEGIKESHGDGNEVFVEVVEYTDGVTICAVYEKDAQPGRCHHGGADSDHHGWSWHDNNHTKLNFNVKVPRGVLLKAITTNGGIRGRDLNSVVEAATTNGNVDVSTSEWVSGRTTNGGVTVAMGSAKWSGEIELVTTNGSVHASLPASAEFKVRAATTNGGIHTDFPVTVMGSFGSKDLSGTVGGGGRDLRMATTNGGIEIRKNGS
jgi:Putative adhesin